MGAALFRRADAAAVDAAAPGRGVKRAAPGDSVHADAAAAPLACKSARPGDACASGSAAAADVTPPEAAAPSSLSKARRRSAADTPASRCALQEAPPCELPFEAAVAGGGGALRDALTHHGYCLVRGVVPDAATHARWVGDIKALVASVAQGPDASFDDADAVYDAARWPLDGCASVFDGYGAGHTAAAWEARLHGRVQRVFAALWHTRRLVSSFDGVCAERPRREALPPADAPPLHTDENPFGRGAATDELLAAQGALSLTPTDASTGGTTLVARSHRVHRTLLADAFPCAALQEDPSLNWYVLTPEERAWLLAQPGCALVDVCTAPGDLLLWDSRTVHCGRRAAGPLPPDAWRFALYLCMWPAARLDATARAAKAAAMGLGARAGLRPESTSHWPDGRELKPRYGWPAAGDAEQDAWARERPPGVRSDGVAAPPPVALSTAALRLAGVMPYDDGSEDEAEVMEGAVA